MRSCVGRCGVRACSKYKSRDTHSSPSVTRSHDRLGQIQTQNRAMPFDSFVDLLHLFIVWANAQIGIRSHFPLCAPIPSLPSSSDSYIFQHGNRICRHSQGSRYRRDDFQAVRTYPNQLPSLLLTSPVCTGNSSVAKSNAKKRQGRWRLPRISLLPSLTLRTM
jgi:hypothetical protein